MRLYLRHCAIGFGLSTAFVFGLLWLDIAGLASLVAGSDVGVLAVFLLWFFHGSLFGAVQFGVMLVLNATDEDDGGSGGGGCRPVPVPARHSSHQDRPVVGPQGRQSGL